jgi:hypothetical protein
MIRHIRQARPSGGHTLELVFDDGTRKRVDVLPLLEGPVFGPLLDPVYFGRVELDPVAGTVAWPNGVDLAPEALYDLPSVDAA